MSDFKAKMHQIRLQLGICPRPRWGSLQRSHAPPDPLAGFKGLLLREGSKGEGGKEEMERKEKGGREGEFALKFRSGYATQQGVKLKILGS